jgi:hypothetical protein
MSFGGILRQSTAVDVLIGPFVDSTDGDAEETGLTIAQADVRLSKNGQTGAQKNDNTTAAHDADGFYNCELDATDTNTVGQLTLWVHVAGALAVRHDYQVMEEVPFDALYAASAAGYGTAQTGDSFARLGAPAGASVSADVAAVKVDTAAILVDTGTTLDGRIPAALVGGRMDANVGAISNDATAADNLETLLDDTAGPVPWMGIIDQGTAQSATGNDIVLRAGNSHANDTLIGATIMVLGSTQGYWQSALITDSVLATDTITVTPNAGWVTPSGTITYKIFATAASSGGSGATAQQVWEYADRQLTALDEDVTTIDINGTTIGTVTTVTNQVTANVTAISGDSAAADNLEAALDGTGGVTISAALTGNITGNLSGSVGSVTGAVGSVTGAVASVTGAVGSVTGNVGGNVVGTVASVVGAVGSVTGLTASDVGAIKAKTDPLTFTVANVLDANVQRINDVAITGDGQVGTEFGV